MMDLRETLSLYISRSDFMSFAACFILKEKGILVRYITDIPDVLRGRPIPALNHNNFVVYDIWPLIEYCEDRFPDPRMWPEDFSQRAACRMILTRIVEDWYPLYTASTLNQLVTELNQLDNHLRTSRFMHGKRLTYTDAFLLPLLNTIDTQDPTLLHSNVKAYLSRLRNRPSFAALGDYPHPLEAVS